LGSNPRGDDEQGNRADGFQNGRVIYQPVTPQPFIDRSGRDLRERFIPLAGLDPDKLSYCNVIKCRGYEDYDEGKRRKTDKLPSKKKELHAIVDHCTHAHLRIPDSSRLLIAVGDLAWEHSTYDAGSITDWRGYFAPSSRFNVPTFAVLHPAFLMRSRRMVVPSYSDWDRIKRWFAGEWPKPVEHCPTHTDRLAYIRWFEAAYESPYVVVDGEWHEDTEQLWTWGMAYPHAGLEEPGFVGASALQFQWGTATQFEKDQFKADYRRLIAKVPIVFHNAMADIMVGQRNQGIAYEEYASVQDTMNAHAVLWSEYPHTLDFLDSVYGWHNKLKHLQVLDPALYNLGDLLSTHHAWRALNKDFRSDPESFSIYTNQSQRLYRPRIDNIEDEGMAVNKPAVLKHFATYTARMNTANQIARAYCGYPINIASEKQLKQWLYKIEKMPVQKDKDTHKSTIDSDAIAVLRRIYYDFDADEERENGGIDPDAALAALDDGAHPVLEARAMFSNSQQIVSHYLVPLLHPRYRHYFTKDKEHASFEVSDEPV